MMNASKNSNEELGLLERAS